MCIIDPCCFHSCQRSSFLKLINKFWEYVSVEGSTIDGISIYQLPSPKCEIRRRGKLSQHCLLDMVWLLPLWTHSPWFLVQDKHRIQTVNSLPWLGEGFMWSYPWRRLWAFTGVERITFLCGYGHWKLARAPVDGSTSMATWKVLTGLNEVYKNINKFERIWSWKGREVMGTYSEGIEGRKWKGWGDKIKYTVSM